MTDEIGPSRVEAWERRTEIPLLMLAFAFLVAYAWSVLDPGLDRDVESYLLVGSWAIWLVFAIEFAFRIWLAHERTAYVRQHWYDVAIIALPVLRPLRLLRLLAFVRIFNRAATRSMTGQVVVYTFSIALMAIGLGALGVLDAEQDVGNIRHFDDALWWACTTVTTVGYGDFYPVTGSGRLVAVLLMFTGLAVVGSITATIAAWLVTSVSTEIN